MRPNDQPYKIGISKDQEQHEREQMPKLKLSSYFRVVVTGDREWPDEGYRLIKAKLERLPSNSLVINGGARGVDTQADLAAHILGFTTRTEKAEWDLYGRGAGHRRNEKMLFLYKPHVVVGWHAHWDDSRGTLNCVTQAANLQIPVRVWDENGKLIYKYGTTLSKLIP